MSEWVSVKDRLPSKFSYYLTVNMNARFVSRFANQRILKFRPKEKKWWWYEPIGYSQDESVTHWMPLPKPPGVSDE